MALRVRALPLNHALFMVQTEIRPVMRLFTEHADTPLERAAARIFRLPLTLAISC